jgi:hypothetical protein
MCAYGVPNNIDHQKESPYITIPLDPDQNSCCSLIQLLTLIDEYFMSDLIKKQLFGFDSDNYKYIPCICKGLNLDYFVVVFESDVADRKMITTQFYDEATQIEVKTLKDVQNCIRFLTTCEFEIQLNKVVV